MEKTDVKTTIGTLKELTENPAILQLCDVILNTVDIAEIPGIFSRVYRIRKKIQKHWDPKIGTIPRDEFLIATFYTADVCTICGGAYFTGGVVCPDCLKKHTTQCPHCGSYITTEESMLDAGYSRARYAWKNGVLTPVCSSCYSHKYKKCDCCGKIRHMAELHPGTNNRVFCDVCIIKRDVILCSGCAEYIMKTDAIYGKCQKCTLSVKKKKAHINGHWSKPRPVFISLNPTFTPIGVELEVDGGQYTDQLLEYLGTLENMLYLETDGSLYQNGLEIITYPCDLEFHKQLIPYAQMFKEIKTAGYKSHDTTTCGIHTHIGKSAFGGSPGTQNKAINRMIYLVEKFRAQFKKFSRRESFHYCEFANLYQPGITVKDLSANYRRRNQQSRYMAINLQNRNTVEFRIFRGTLDLKSYFAILELVDYLPKYVTKHKKDDHYYSMTWTDFISEIPRTHANLKEYLIQRAI